jgi:hypothetical protein
MANDKQDLASKRRDRYETRMKSAGLVKVCLWVPESKKQELLSLANNWRASVKGGQLCLPV